MVSEIQRVKSPSLHHHFSEGCFCFVWAYINLYTVPFTIQCLAKFPWKPWSDNFWFSRYRGSNQSLRHHFSNGCSYFFKYVDLCTVNFTQIKIFLGQQCTVLVKEGGHTLQFQQPRTQGRFKTKNCPGYEHAFSTVSFAYEKGRLKQIFLFADYDQLFKSSGQKLCKLEREHSNIHFSNLLLSSNMRQHKTKYIQRIAQLSLYHGSNSYFESMQPPLHKHNSVYIHI